MNVGNRASLNPLLKWLWDFMVMFQANAIQVPTEYEDQVLGIKEVLRSDISGLVNSVLDFSINCALVNYTIETENSNLSELLNKWLAGVNSDLRGKIPVGIQALAKEYFRERWKGSSLLLLRTQWEKKDGFILPTKLWFLDGVNIKIKDPNEGARVIGEENYYLRVNENKYLKLPRDKDELDFIQKPYSSWSSLYPTPYLIQKGIYKNLKVLELISTKGENIVAKALEYLLTLKKGSDVLTQQNITYDEKDLNEAKEKLKKLIADSKTEPGTPNLVSNFDTELEHFIPDYSKAIKQELYSPIERRLLAGLGLVEIIEGTTSTRREAVLNPKPFVVEVRQSIEDFKSLLKDIVMTIIEKNEKEHRKYTNNSIHIHSTPIKAFISDAVRDHLRSMYDRGDLSKQTYAEICGEDVNFDVEVQRRLDEYEDGLEDLMYPPVIQNTEGKTERLTEKIEPTKQRQPEKIKKDKVPVTKQGPEAKNFKGSLELSLVKCKKCEQEFDFEKSSDDIIEKIACPHCSQDLTDDDIEFLQTILASEEDLEQGKIVKRKDGYYVLSEKTGKSLGGPYKTRKQALKRLRQVEYFKHKGEVESDGQ